MTAPDYPDHVRLADIKGRKGHLCQGGRFDLRDGPVCGCGVFLDDVPDFMDLPPAVQRQATRTGAAPADPHGAIAAELGWAPNDASTAPFMPADSPSPYGPDEPPHIEDGPDHPRMVDSPPAPFTHANGEPCYGCQSCFANMDIDYDVPDSNGMTNNTAPTDPMAEADQVEAAGRDVIVRHDAPDMTPSVPVIDPTQPYGPAEVERAILDANARLERGSKHEANLIAAADQLKIDYELAYARAIEQSAGGAADQRKANATLACERELRAWREAVAARDAMRAITHSLRSTVSALQSVGRSIGVSYTGPQGRGR